MKNLPEIIRYLSNLSPIIPIIIFFTWRQKRSKIINIIGILLFVSTLTDIITFIMGINHIKPYYIFNIYTIAEFFLLSYIYHLLGKNKKIIYITSLLFIAFFVIDTLFIEPIYQFQSVPLFVEGLIFIIYSVAYYIKMLKVTPPIDPIIFYPFWVNSAVFYYFSFNLFLFICGNYIFTNMPRDVSLTFWGFHNFNNIMKNLLFAVGIYIAGKGLTKQKLQY